MSIAKTAATTLLALVIATQVSVAAMAEDSESEDDNKSYTVPTRPANPEPNWRGGHGDKPKRHGDDDFQISVPPMVITPYEEEVEDDEDEDVNGSAFEGSDDEDRNADPSDANAGSNSCRKQKK